MTKDDILFLQDHEGHAEQIDQLRYWGVVDYSHEYRWDDVIETAHLLKDTYKVRVCGYRNVIEYSIHVVSGSDREELLIYHATQLLLEGSPEDKPYADGFQCDGPWVEDINKWFHVVRELYEKEAIRRKREEWCDSQKKVREHDAKVKRFRKTFIERADNGE